MVNRFYTYIRKLIETGQIETCEFAPEHFMQAGFRRPMTAMPVLEAHELVNRWNREQKRFVYWLE